MRTPFFFKIKNIPIKTCPERKECYLILNFFLNWLFLFLSSNLRDLSSVFQPQASVQPERINKIKFIKLKEKIIYIKHALRTYLISIEGYLEFYYSYYQQFGLMSTSNEGNLNLGGSFNLFSSSYILEKVKNFSIFIA